jgi:aminoglycoside phosphotransferase (APT) family kinase protein
MSNVAGVATPWRRNLEDVAPALARWVRNRMGAAAELGECTMPANGMANETVLFDVGPDRYVARLAPPPDSPYPTFPTFDLAFQRDCMELVRARTEVPVPDVIALEEDLSWLGTPFLVMRRVEGQIPGDSPPYMAAGWMTELSGADLARLEENTVRRLAAIHTIAHPADLTRFARPDLGATALEQQLAYQREYYEWARDGRTVPAIEDGFRVLAARLPASDRTVLNWGDSRIGNVIYRDCEPVAILDWEMATAGPPEVDVAWMVFMHTFLQQMATAFGLAGMPDLLRRDRVVELYERYSGAPLADLGWYVAFAGVRFAIIMVRMALRGVAFGGSEPVDPDDLTLFAGLLRGLVAEVGP